MSIWYCKVGTLHDIDLPSGADWPMRKAIQQAFTDLTGRDDAFCFSGWGAELTEGELAVVEKREPVRELVANESPEMLRAALAAERERADRAEAGREALRAERDIECDRALRAEARVGYYERALCIGDMREWVRDPHERSSFAVKAISPERVTGVLEERDALRERVARLVGAATEVLRISDRKHDAWDALRTALEGK